MNTEQNKPDKKNTKPSKLKSCGICSKEFPVLWKRITVDSKQLSVCKGCADKHLRKKAKEKAVRTKQKRKEKREKITEKKLDTIFSRLVRTIYPPICHSSGVPITFSTSHAAHLISRRNRCVRWDLRNVYPTTPAENLYNQIHIFGLAKKLQEYYGIDVHEFNAAAQCSCKISYPEKQQMYQVFKDGLEEYDRIQLMQSGKEQAIIDLRNFIVNVTKRIM